MLGDTENLKNSYFTVDEKGRVYIPASSGREVGEELAILYDKNLDVYEIYPYKKIIEKIDKLNERINSTINNDEAKELKKQLYEFLKSIVNNVKVDKQGRISLGTEKKLKSTKVMIIGARDHLILEKVPKNK